MASGTCGTNATWNLDESTGVLTISGTGAITDYSNGMNYDSHPFFNYRTVIKSCVITNGITRVGNRILSTCTSLENVTIGDDVQSIGTQSFYRCTALKSVTIGSNVTSIEQHAFKEDAAITTIKFKCETAPTMAMYSFYLGTDSWGTVEIQANATVYTKGGWGSDEVFTSTIKGSVATTFTYKKLGAYPPVNVGGEWKESTPYVNVGGEWKEVTGIYVNVSGTWKEVQ